MQVQLKGSEQTQRLLKQSKELILKACSDSWLLYEIVSKWILWLWLVLCRFRICFCSRCVLLLIRKQKLQELLAKTTIVKSEFVKVLRKQILIHCKNMNNLACCCSLQKWWVQKKSISEIYLLRLVQKSRILVEELFLKVATILSQLQWFHLLFLKSMELCLVLKILANSSINKSWVLRR